MTQHFCTGLAIMNVNETTTQEEEEGEEQEQEQDDPSPFLNCVLRCATQPFEEQLILWWHSQTKPVPLSVEEELIDVLIPYHRRERGMFLKQSYHRKRELRRLCEIKQVKLRMALSLRRHHMKRLNPYLTLEQLHLGDEDTIRESARLFEVAVQEFLERSNVTFYSEDDQRAFIEQHRQPGQPSPPTPDFILKKPIRIRKYRKVRGNAKEIFEETSVSWIEVKMFYGASTIVQNNRSAVGCLMNTARKYVKLHGPGAMVFIYGCGDRLTTELNDEGVMVLDCSSKDTVQLDAVDAHMRTYCCDANGDILP